MLHPPTTPAAAGFPWHHRMMRLLRGAAAVVAGFVAVAILAANPAAAAETGRAGHLVDPAWLQQHRDQVLLLDASMTPQHGAGHIPGAVSADRYRYGAAEPSRAARQRAHRHRARGGAGAAA